MDGWAADQHGWRSNRAFPGDGEPGTVNVGRSRTYHMEGWADIFCSRRWCSAEAKQQGAVKRLELASKLQQGTFLQDSLEQIEIKIQLMLKPTNIKKNNDGNEVQQD